MSIRDSDKMKSKKPRTLTPTKEQLQKQLQRKNSTITKYKRELKIEVALEIVRARTMAMKQSDELKDAAALLFQQIKTLGLPVISCGYNIWEKEETICTAWMSNAAGLLLPPFRVPLTESPVFIRFYDSKQKGEKF